MGVTEEGEVRGHSHKHSLHLQPAPTTATHPFRGLNECGGGGTFVFMHTLVQLNGKDQWQIVIGHVDSGGGVGGLEQALSQSENL